MEEKLLLSNVHMSWSGHADVQQTRRPPQHGITLRAVRGAWHVT